MKRLISFIFIFLLLFCSVANAANNMTVDEFLENYPNPYIYRIHLDNGYIEYVSSPYELTFFWKDNSSGGKMFKCLNPNRGTFYNLSNSGRVFEFDWEEVSFKDHVLEENMDKVKVYQWNGSGFFLLFPSVMKMSLEAMKTDLAGLTRTILLVGFGVASVMLLIRLLKAFFRFFLHRLI